MSEGRSIAHTLGESEMRYRALFESMMDGIASCQVIVDEAGHPVDWVYLDVNHAFEELTGLRDVVGKKVSEVIPGLRESNPELLEIYGRVASSGHPATFESYVPTLQTRFRVSVFCPQPGQFVAIFENVTQQRQAEEALRQSEERARESFRRLNLHLDQSPLAIVEWDSSFHITRWSGTAQDVFGWSADETLGKRIDELPWLYEEDRAGVAQVTDDMMSARRPSNVNKNRNRRKDGAVIHCEWYNTAIHDSSGQLTSVLSQVVDVTERKRMEAELRQANALLQKEIAEHRQTEAALAESEMRLRFVLENSVDATYRRNLRSDRCEYMSPACERLFGYTPAEMLEMPLEVILAHIHPEDRPRLEHALTGSRCGEDVSYRVEYRFRHKNGAYRWVSDVFTVIRDDQGRPLHRVGNVRDIDDQKAMEERLRQSEKLASVGLLAGGIAHNFNNQLASILGHADLLRERLQDERLRRYATNILTSSRKAADLTAQLLAFARKGRYFAAPVDMHQLVDDTVLLLQETVDRRIEVRKHLAADHATVVGDPTQLQNALLNLGLNARDAMPTGGVLVFETTTVDLAESGANALGVSPGRYLQLSVTDSGTGMSLETQGHLFEPFFTTKDVGQGTGLGLAAVHGTVKSHHGAVTVWSEVGQGSTFTLHLPLHQEAAPSTTEDPAVEGRTRAYPAS